MISKQSNLAARFGADTSLEEIVFEDVGKGFLSSSTGSKALFRRKELEREA